MFRAILSLVLLTTLTGCYCRPEIGEGVDGGYLSTCWGLIENAPRNQVLFPKP
jgi:hypothetical protein